MPLHPQARALLDLLASLDGPPIESQTPEAARAARAALVRPSELEVGDVRELRFPTLDAPATDARATGDRDDGGDGAAADGERPARLYVPPGAEDRTTGALVWLHGGGWVLGSIDGHDDLCRHLCLVSGHRVVSLGYRLAPEHPFPAGLDDARSGLRWVVDHASSLGIDPDRLALGGDSAGANLAAVVAMNPPVALRQQVLVYPVTDARGGTGSYEEFGEGHFLTASGMRWFVDLYLSGDGGDPADPEVSPLLASDDALAASPPTLVMTAACDVLRDEGVAFARRLTDAGVTTTHVEFAGQIHGFVSMGDIIDDAHAARGLIGGLLARVLAPA